MEGLPTGGPSPAEAGEVREAREVLVAQEALAGPVAREVLVVPEAQVAREAQVAQVAQVAHAVQAAREAREAREEDLSSPIFPALPVPSTYPRHEHIRRNATSLNGIWLCGNREIPRALLHLLSR